MPIPMRASAKRLRRVLWTTALALLSACGSPAPAVVQARVHQSDHHPYRVMVVVEGLEHPWGMAFLPGGDMLVTERPGRLRLIRQGALEAEPIAGVPPVFARGQGGLLDVALHPEFEANRLVYLSFSKPGPRGATTAVVRGRLEGNRLEGVEEIFEAEAWARGGPHYGSRLVFDGRGHLFVSVGERGEMSRAQDLSEHAGSIHRLNEDGSVPPDNPFVGREGARPEIYTWGNRNPQGMALHPETGELWAVEHGPRGGDELNRILPGRNYGWPVITYGIDYDGSKISDETARPGMEQPVHYWVPSIATSGLAFYTGDRFPQWKGDAFVGGLVAEELARLDLEDGRVVGEERLLRVAMRIRDVRDGPDGYLYVLVDAPNAPLLRLEPGEP